MFFIQPPYLYQRGCMKKVERIKKNCLTCGNEMEVLPKQVDTKKYCSRKCLYSSKERNEKIRNANTGVVFSEERKSKISKRISELHSEGEIYGEEFRKKISDTFKGKPAWNSGTATIKECINCGSEYKSIGKRKHTSKYCSMQCRVEYENSEKDIDKIEYYKQVWKITESQPLELLEGYDINKRTRIDLDENAYHIDHIVPIIYGYENNIPPEELGNIKNLQFIKAIENHRKSKKL